jgi:hypothetical protein
MVETKHHIFSGFSLVVLSTILPLMIKSYIKLYADDLRFLLLGLAFSMSFRLDYP